MYRLSSCTKSKSNDIKILIKPNTILNHLQPLLAPVWDLKV